MSKVERTEWVILADRGQHDVAVIERGIASGAAAFRRRGALEAKQPDGDPTIYYALPVDHAQRMIEEVKAKRKT